METGFPALLNIAKQEGPEAIAEVTDLYDNTIRTVVPKR
jgi:hypothetical protein